MTIDGFAAAVVREDGAWKCSLLAPELLDDLDGVITGLRRVATTGPVFGMLAVDDEFFVIVRPIPGGAALLLSDATAGLDYDIAADVLDLLQVRSRRTTRSTTTRGRRAIWRLLADLGVPEQEMQLIVDEVDLYPDEQLAHDRRSAAASASVRGRARKGLTRAADGRVRGRGRADRDDGADPARAGARRGGLRHRRRPDRCGACSRAGGSSSARAGTRGRRPATRPRTPRSSRCVRPPRVSGPGT